MMFYILDNLHPYINVSQNTMNSKVLHNHEEATYITVETVSFYGVKVEPENVTVNSQEAAFTYHENQVRYFLLDLDMILHNTIFNQLAFISKKCIKRLKQNLSRKKFVRRNVMTVHDPFKQIVYLTQSVTYNKILI